MRSDFAKTLIGIIAAALVVVLVLVVARKSEPVPGAPEPRPKSTFVPFEQPRYATAQPAHPPSMQDYLARDDLAAAAHEAIATKQPDMMLLGARIIQQCTLAWDVNINEESLNATLAHLSDIGDTRSAETVRLQLADLARVRHRCRNFPQRSWDGLIEESLKTEIEACRGADSDVVRVASAVWVGCGNRFRRDGKVPPPPVINDADIASLLAVPNRIRVELAVYAMLEKMPRLANGDYNVVADLALHEASTLVYGDTWWSYATEFDRLGQCMVNPKVCDAAPNAKPDLEYPSGYFELVARYADALRSGDIKGIVK